MLVALALHFTDHIFPLLSPMTNVHHAGSPCTYDACSSLDVPLDRRGEV